MGLQSVPDATTLGAIGNAVNCANIPLHQHTPYEIFLYYPAENRRFTSAKVAIPTSHLVSLIIDCFDATTTAKRLKLYGTWIGIEPLAATTGRFLWHLVKEDLFKGGVYPLKKPQIKEKLVNYHRTTLMDSPSSPDCYLVIDGSAEHTVAIATKKPYGTCSPVQIEFYKNLDSDVLADGAFYLPISATAPTFDFIHVQRRQAVLFQCIVSNRHNIKEVELEKVSNVARKLGIQDVISIRVVPKGKESTMFVIDKNFEHGFPFNLAGQYVLPFEPVYQA